MSKPLRLLIENRDDIEILTESSNGSQFMYLEGIFAQAEIINANGRFYNKGILEKTVERYNKERVRVNRGLGELNHPDYPMPDPDKAAILTTELRWEGNNVIGKARVLNTPKGQTVRALCEGGFNMGVSTRCLGSLTQKGDVKYVDSNLYMTAIDCVDGPGGPDCYVKSITESASWALNESGVWVPTLDESENDSVNEQLFLELIETRLKNFKI